MNCKKCGRELRVGTKRCPYCGSLVPVPGSGASGEFKWNLQASSSPKARTTEKRPQQRPETKPEKKPERKLEWGEDKLAEERPGRNYLQGKNTWKEPEEAQQLFTFDIKNEKLQKQIDKKVEQIAADQPAPAIERVRNEDLFTLPAEMTMDDFSDLLNDSGEKQNNDDSYESESRVDSFSAESSKRVEFDVEPIESILDRRPEVIEKQKEPEENSSKGRIVYDREVFEAREMRRSRSPEDQEYDPFKDLGLLYSGIMNEVPEFLSAKAEHASSGEDEAKAVSGGFLDDLEGSDAYGNELDASPVWIDPGYTEEDEKKAAEIFQSLISVEEAFSDTMGKITSLSNEEREEAEAACERRKQAAVIETLSHKSLDEEYEEYRKLNNIPKAPPYEGKKEEQDQEEKDGRRKTSSRGRDSSRVKTAPAQINRMGSAEPVESEETEEHSEPTEKRGKVFPKRRRDAVISMSDRSAEIEDILASEEEPEEFYEDEELFEEIVPEEAVEEFQPDVIQDETEEELDDFLMSLMELEPVDVEWDEEPEAEEEIAEYEEEYFEELPEEEPEAEEEITEYEEEYFEELPEEEPEAEEEITEYEEEYFEELPEEEPEAEEEITEYEEEYFEELPEEEPEAEEEIAEYEEEYFEELPEEEPEAEEEITEYEEEYFEELPEEEPEVEEEIAEYEEEYFEELPEEEPEAEEEIAEYEEEYFEELPEEEPEAEEEIAEYEEEKLEELPEEEPEAEEEIVEYEEESQEEPVEKKGKEKSSDSLIERIMKGSLKEAVAKMIGVEDDDDDDEDDEEEQVKEAAEKTPAINSLQKKPREVNIKINEPSGTEVRIHTEEIHLSSDEESMKNTQQVNLEEIKEGPKGVKVEVEVNHSASSSSVEVIRDTDGATVVRTIESDTGNQRTYSAGPDDYVQEVEKDTFWENNSIPATRMTITDIFGPGARKFVTHWDEEEEQRREQGLENAVHAPESAKGMSEEEKDQLEQLLIDEINRTKEEPEQDAADEELMPEAELIAEESDVSETETEEENQAPNAAERMTEISAVIEAEPVDEPEVEEVEESEANTEDSESMKVLEEAEETDFIEVSEEAEEADFIEEFEESEDVDLMEVSEEEEETEHFDEAEDEIEILDALKGEEIEVIEVSGEPEEEAEETEISDESEEKAEILDEVEEDAESEAADETRMKRSRKIRLGFKRSDDEDSEEKTEASSDAPKRLKVDKVELISDDEDDESEDDESKKLFHSLGRFKERLADVIGAGEEFDDDDDDEEEYYEVSEDDFDFDDDVSAEEIQAERRAAEQSEEEDSSEERGSSSLAVIMRLVIFILLLAIVVEFGIIGIKLFAPDSRGAVLINRIETSITGKNVSSSILSEISLPGDDIGAEER